MTVLVWDVETNGLVRDDLPDDHPTQPHIVQLAAILLDGGFRHLDTLDLIIRPEGWRIPLTASRIHGITEERALAEGIPEAEALGRFMALAARAERRVAHNASFDTRVLRIALTRLLHAWDVQPVFCTMEATRDLCCLPPTEAMVATGRTWHKSPRLAEAYEHLFERAMRGAAHDALADCHACAEIYSELAQRGLAP